MMPPELQPRLSRPYIASSISAPTFSTFNGGYSPERSPNPNNLGFKSSKNPRFSPSSFVHNARIVLAVVPSAVFLLDLGGAPVVGTLIVGLMISYIFDSLSFKSGAFFGLWSSLIAAQIVFFFLKP